MFAILIIIVVQDEIVGTENYVEGADMSALAHESQVDAKNEEDMTGYMVGEKGGHLNLLWEWYGLRFRSK